MQLPKKVYECLSFDHEQQILLTSYMRISNASKSLYKLLPHPYILHTKMGSFGKLNSTKRIKDAWLLAFNYVQHSKPEDIAHTRRLITNNDDDSSSSHEAQLEFLNKCMTSLHLLSPEVMALFGYVTLTSHRPTRSSFERLIAAHNLMKNQSQNELYIDNCEMNAVLGYISYLLMIEYGGLYKSDVEEYLGKCKSKDGDLNYFDRLLSIVSGDAIPIVTDNFYSNK